MAWISREAKNMQGKTVLMNLSGRGDKDVDQELIDLMKSKGTWQAASTLSREIVYSMAVMPWINDPFFTRGVTPGTLTALRSPEREKAVMLGAIGRDAVGALAAQGWLGSSMTNPSIGYGFIYSAEVLLLLATAAMALGWNTQNAASRHP